MHNNLNIENKIFMKSREQRIKEFLATPLQIGEIFSIKEYRYEIVEIFDNHVIAKHLNYSYKSLEQIYIKNIERNIKHIGYNPFIDSNRYTKVINYDINTIMSLLNRSRDIYFENYIPNGVAELNWNPYVTLKDKEKFYYQRDFCWTLKNKQNFINSLYKGLELGRIVVYKREYELVEKELQKGNLECTFYDIVDGKQRLKTLIDFFDNKFCDKDGYYWKDLSIYAQHKIQSQQTLIYIQLDSECPDQDILQMFLNNAVEGVKLDTKHLDTIREKIILI